MKKIIFALFCAILIFACQIPQGDTGNVTIITPKEAPLTRSIAGIADHGALLNDNQNRVRYEIGVENEGRRIASIQLKNDEQTTITVPAGVKLDFGVGLYLSESNGSDNELWNSYVISDVKRSVMLMPNETVYLDFTLNYNKPTRVESYFPPLTGVPGLNDAPGTAEITGGVIFPQIGPLSSFPLFTYTDLRTDTPKVVGYDSATKTFQNLTPTTAPFALNGTPKVFNVVDPDGKTFWLIDDYGIYRNNGLSASFADDFVSGMPIEYKEAANRNYLSQVRVFFNFRYNDSYYYFLNYGKGIITTRHDVSGSTWYRVSRIDFTDFDYIYPDLPFLLDIEQDAAPDGGNAFFVSKIGAFYVDSIALDYFSEGKRSEGVNRLKKLIRIPDPVDPRRSVLVTNVEALGNKIYLATRAGLYRINKGSAWNEFKNKEISGSYTAFDENEIENIGEFHYEPVISLDLTGPSNNILVAATPRRVWFENQSNGKTDTVTVWDGIPFIPEKKFGNPPEVNYSDYRVHDTAPIRFVLWDNANSKFWIGTVFGLCSIELSKLF